jgi:hypothetical protein
MQKQSNTQQQTTQKKNSHSKKKHNTKHVHNTTARASHSIAHSHDNNVFIGSHVSSGGSSSSRHVSVIVNGDDVDAATLAARARHANESREY